MKFHSRKYRSGDAVAINQLYYEVTGRRRSLKSYHWQWQKAPGGPGEIWLIEAENPNGTKKLVGHHGIMPVRFTDGGKNLLAGKTENTMVHPGYRNKFLYIRFEKKFLDSYANRFDLLFSTTGPKPAIRLRSALGYKAEKQWEKYAWAINTGAYPSFISYGLKHKGRYGFHSLLMHVSESAESLHNVFHRIRHRRGKLPLRILRSKEACMHSFFRTFWDRARNDYGITPRRDAADLIWRFWNNPNATFITLIFNDSINGEAYAIVQPNDKHVFTLMDIACYPASLHLYSKVLEAVCDYIDGLGGNLLLFWSTSDSYKFGDAFSSLKYPNLFGRFPFNRVVAKKGSSMPRKVNRRGLENKNWFITPIVFEGRQPGHQIPANHTP